MEKNKKIISIESKILVDEAINECHKQDIDFLASGNGSGEQDYIKFMKGGYERAVASVIQHFPGDGVKSRQQIRILETASYLGVVAIALAKAGYSVTATDIPEYINHAGILERYSKNSITAVALNLRTYPLPWEEEAFDVILAAEVLEHFNFNPVPLMVEFNRILKRQGALYIATPNALWLPKRLRFLMGNSIHDPIDAFFAQLEALNGSIVGMHWREYTKAELRDLLEKSGFLFEEHNFCSLAPVSSRRHTPRALILQKMYQLFPEFLPGQVVWAKKLKVPKVTIKFTESTALNHI